MAQQNLDTGTPGDNGTGEFVNASLVKCEANFTDLYTNKANENEVFKADGSVLATGDFNMNNEGLLNIQYSDWYNGPSDPTKVMRAIVNNGGTDQWQLRSPSLMECLSVAKAQWLSLTIRIIAIAAPPAIAVYIE